jgi:hypothetical protein
VGTKKIVEERTNAHDYSILMVKTKESGIDNKGIFTKFCPECVAEKSAFVTWA